MGLISSTCGYSVSPVLLVEDAVFPPVCIFGIFVKWISLYLSTVNYFSEIECKLLVSLIYHSSAYENASHSKLSINIQLLSNGDSHYYNKITELVDLQKVRVYIDFMSMIETACHDESVWSLSGPGNKEEGEENGAQNLGDLRL